MQIGMVGLGRMGANMARRLLKSEHDCVVYDRAAEAVRAMEAEGATGASSLEDLVEKLAEPKTVWLMLPAGEPTENTVIALGKLLPRGSIIIDGGNSFYKDDARRSAMVKALGITYVDVGTSGGVSFDWGYCLMIGGDRATVQRLEPLFSAVAPGPGNLPRTPGRNGFESTAEKGFLYCGPSGAGHFVKMVHNGIEYGVMQAFAEGFDILHGATSVELPPDLRYNLKLADIAELWRRGSIIGSCLLDLTATALAENPALTGSTGFLHDSGEGSWTVHAALEESVPAEVLTAALYSRFHSRQKHTFAEKMLSAMRQKFGGQIEEFAEDDVV